MMLGVKEPWPLGERLDQRDPRLSMRSALKPYGCAFMLTVEAGRWLAGGRPWTPLQITALYDEACSQGIVRERDAFIEQWQDMVNLAAGRLAVKYTDRHEPADFPYSPEYVVFRCYERQDMDVGQHFVYEQPDADIQYDPLGSAAPGLSNSRKHGVIVSSRAFRIL